MPSPFPVAEGQDILIDPRDYLVSAYFERGGANPIGGPVIGTDIEQYDDPNFGLRSGCFDSGSSDWLDGNEDSWVNENSYPGANVAGLSTDNPATSALQLCAANGVFANETDIMAAAGFPGGFSIPQSLMVGKDIDSMTLNQIYDFFRELRWHGQNASWTQVDLIGPDLYRFTLDVTTTSRWKAFVYDHSPRDVANPPHQVGTLIALGSGDGSGSCSIVKDHSVVNDTHDSDLVVFFYPHFAFCP